MHLKIGDVLYQSSVAHCTFGITEGYKAPQGEVFVSILVGRASKRSPEEFDPIKALNSLGWVAGNEVEELRNRLSKAEAILKEAHRTLDKDDRYPIEEIADYAKEYDLQLAEEPVKCPPQ